MNKTTIADRILSRKSFDYMMIMIRAVYDDIDYYKDSTIYYFSDDSSVIVNSDRVFINKPTARIGA